MAQETQTGALYQPRGVRWGGRWEGASKGRGYMYTKKKMSKNCACVVHVCVHAHTHARENM